MLEWGNWRRRAQRPEFRNSGQIRNAEPHLSVETYDLGPFSLLPWKQSHANTEFFSAPNVDPKTLVGWPVELDCQIRKLEPAKKSKWGTHSYEIMKKKCSLERERG